MDVKFRPVTKIRRSIDGKLVLVFSPRVIYDGVLNPDKTVIGYSPEYDKHIKIGLNDYMIEH